MRNVPDLLREFDRPFSNLFGRDFDRPFNSFRPLLEQMDKFMRDIPSSMEGWEGMKTLVPFCDVKEKSDHYILNFDMPGLEKDNINVEVEGNRLIVSGERKQDKEEKGERTRLMERQYTRFERILTLPTGVKSEDLEATYQSGVLSIALPKSAEVKKHKVSIGEGKTGFLSKIFGESSKKEKVVVDSKNAESAGAKL